jgi:hypothetical protein
MADLGFGLGRLVSPDARDRSYPMQLAIRNLKPAPRKQPYKLGPTLDQGHLPQCVGYSTRDKLASAPFMVPDGKGPTPQQIYDGAQTLDEWPGNDYDGTTVRGAFKFLQEEGYLKSYVWAQNVIDCEQFIRGGYGTIILGTNWYDGMFEPDKNGFVRPVGNVVGGHAYHLFWMDPTHQEAWCKNSWGERWGMRLNSHSGCFKLSYSALDKLLGEEGEAGAGLEVHVK